MQSDGTSDTSAVRYDAACGRASAFKPAPEAGQWFNAYFEMLLKMPVLHLHERKETGSVMKIGFGRGWGALKHRTGELEM